MGGLISSPVAEALQKHQEQMREAKMKNMEKELALQIARNRDICKWLLACYVVSTVGLIRGYRKTGKTTLIAPLVPLTFLTGYVVDLAYGNKIHKVRREAEHILTNEKELLKSPEEKPPPKRNCRSWTASM